MSIPCVKCSGEGSLFKSRYGGNVAGLAETSGRAERSAAA